MGLPRTEDLPHYPINQTGVTELNVCIMRENVAYDDTLFNPVLDLMKTLCIEGTRFAMNDAGPKDPPSLFVDLKFGIPNGLLPEVAQSLNRIHRNIEHEQKCQGIKARGLWDLCSFQTEDGLQEFVLRLEDVPPGNIDNDGSMGTYAHQSIPVYVVVLTTTGGEQSNNVFIGQHWENEEKVKARAKKWLTQAIREDLQDSYAKADWEEFETYGDDFIIDKLEENGGEYTLEAAFVAPQP